MTAPADLEARIRAAREESQRRFDLALPRRGTTNRRLTEWVSIGGHDFPISSVSAGGPPSAAGTEGPQTACPAGG